MLSTPNEWNKTARRQINQLCYFESEFILLLVVQAPRLAHQIAEVVFDEHHRRVELLMHRLFALIRQLQIVAAT